MDKFNEKIEVRNRFQYLDEKQRPQLKHEYPILKLKDLQRAAWINYELSRKPYFGFNQKDDVEDPEDKQKEGGLNPKELEELKELEIDPEVIEMRKREHEK